MPRTEVISGNSSVPEVKKANNIDCPRCGSQNCFVNEVDDVVEIECQDCGLQCQELIRCPECGDRGEHPAGPHSGCEEFTAPPECIPCGGSGLVGLIQEGHKIIFVYGSLRGGLYNSGRCGHMKFVCNASLKGYGLFSLGYYPAIVKNKDNGHAVIGEVYDVDETTFRRLNSMELGAGYDEVEGEVELSTGKKLKVIFWEMSWERFSRGMMNPESRLVTNGDWVRVERDNGNYKEV